MRNPVKWYLELVDGDAFDKAQSGNPVSQYEAPFLPLLFPWLIGGPLLPLLPPSSRWGIAVFGTTFALSVLCWGAVAWFWYRRVEIYRDEKGVKIERRPYAFVLLIGIALAVSIAISVFVSR